MKAFKVIHLSTTHTGGAGLAARRLNQSLNILGVESVFLALSRLDFQVKLNEVSIKRNFTTKFLSGIMARLQSNLSSKVFFSLFNFSSVKTDFVRSFGDPKDVILHFHNWFNLVSQKQIFQLANVGYRVVITLHDERFFTGGCHYALNCHKFVTDCFPCPELKFGLNWIPRINLQNSVSQIKSNNLKITFISPSMWLLVEAKKSILLKDQDVRFVPNSLGYSKDSNPVKRSRNFNGEFLVLGVASMDPKSYIKGGDLTQEIEHLIFKNRLPVRIEYMNKYGQDEIAIDKFWSDIDYLLVLSRADNSPNVIHEAKNRGIPIIASKVGGIEELLDSKYDIPVDLNDLNPQTLIEKFLKILQLGILPETSSVIFSRYQDYSRNSLEEHIKIYQELINIA